MAVGSSCWLRSQAFLPTVLTARDATIKAGLLAAAAAVAAAAVAAAAAAEGAAAVVLAVAVADAVDAGVRALNYTRTLQ